MWGLSINHMAKQTDPPKRSMCPKKPWSYRLHENTDQFGANTSSASKLQRCYSLRRRIGFLFLFKWGKKKDLCGPYPVWTEHSSAPKFTAFIVPKINNE